MTTTTTTLYHKIISILPLPSSRNWTDIDDALEREDLITTEKLTSTPTCPDPPTFETRYRDLQRTYRNLKRIFIIFGFLSACLLVILILPWWKDDEVTTVPVTFERDERFISSSPKTDENWGALMPPGDGFIHLPNPPPSIPPGKDGNIYDVSLFHQLHCLSHIRTYLYTMQYSLNSTSSDPWATYRILLEPQEDHVEHCFDYLRQGIMCAGDLTLEWPRTEADGRRFVVDGWGVEHQCKDWDAILRYMEENTVARHF